MTNQKRYLKAFLCHASGDKPQVPELYKHLIADGVDASLDQENLLPGQDWRVEIPRAVREADVVICLCNKSIPEEGYVQKEIKTQRLSYLAIFISGILRKDWAVMPFQFAILEHP